MNIFIGNIKIIVTDEKVEADINVRNDMDPRVAEIIKKHADALVTELAEAK